MLGPASEQQPVPGSEIAGPAELREREDEIKQEETSPPPTFRVPFTLRLPHYLRAWNRLSEQ